MLFLLCKKWVWIPSVSVLLLALIGAVAWMQFKSAQERHKLQAVLLQTQKNLDQQIINAHHAAIAAPPTAFHKKDIAQDATRPDTVSLPNDRSKIPSVASAAADSKPGIDSGDCLVTDKESVAASLRGCIESFNNSTAGSRTADRKP